ncbi:response regulator transcription factor [Paenibacillus sp. PR3]|uniref:Response regulator transcription factor n=1 Tax=Paenibacillus terricola TaxID=2763503 RepID=A0ABR8N1F2_9BACL|nr:response regulator transcription factor [Paenibacillus terricola]MBD3922010.1 response regulator transcription factor [Paenibacillus terricola]
MNQIVIVVDGNPRSTSASQQIQAEPDMEVAALMHHGLSALEHIWRHPIDLMLLDTFMPVAEGVAYIQAIRMIAPRLPIVIVASDCEEDSIIQYLAYGANGYLVRDQNFSNVVQVVRDVLKGQHVYPNNVATMLAQYLLRQLNGSSSPIKFPMHLDHQFSDREKQIIQLLMQRLTNQEIADALGLSQGTIKNHLTHIFSKIPAKNRREAVRALTQMAASN